MKWSNTSTQWGAVTQLFHWGMLLLFIVQYTLAYAMVDMPDSDQKWALFAWHKQIGVTLLFLVFLRLWWRERNVIPKNSEKSPRWDHILSKSNIWILYILMFCFPLTGFLFSVLGGNSVSYFGLFTIPAFMKGPNSYAEAFLTAHIVISYALYVFVGLHILGGLYHYFIVKDKVLQSMLP
ncbi:MAG TPA: cytochrome b [Alphaproteobacteria bacterium]|nr:cytochrome b [Alphaproteobacteria bacterium]